MGRERERKRGLDPNQFRPTDLPRGFQVKPALGCLSHAGCWQVFGLASISAFAASLLSTASQLQRASACRGFVLAYRCGAVPESHRVPFCSLRILREPAWVAVYCGIRYLSTAMVWVMAVPSVRYRILKNESCPPLLPGFYSPAWANTWPGPGGSDRRKDRLKVGTWSVRCGAAIRTERTICGL